MIRVDLKGTGKPWRNWFLQKFESGKDVNCDNKGDGGNECGCEMEGNKRNANFITCSGWKRRMQTAGWKTAGNELSSQEWGNREWNGCNQPAEMEM